MFGLSFGHLLVVLVIVVLIFGTKRLKNVGQDLGEAIKGFKKGMQDDDAAPVAEHRPAQSLPPASAPGEVPPTPTATTTTHGDHDPPVAP